MTEEIMCMVEAEKLRFAEMNQYMERIQDNIKYFTNAGTTVKIEIMHDILLDAQSFIDYYTEE